MSIGQIAGFLTPLGAPGALFILFLFVAVFLRKNRISENTAFVRYQALETQKILGDLASARDDRERAEKDADRWRGVAQGCYRLAFVEHLGRAEDRQAHRLHETKSGIEQLVLPPLSDLPVFEDVAA